MPGSMPYVLDKGPYFSVIESILANPSMRADRLIQLRAGQLHNGVTPGPMLADLCGFNYPSLAAGPADVADHLNRQWFGMTQLPGGAWVKGDCSGPQTGWWTGYVGDPEATMREGMIRAIEVSFGIDHGAAAPLWIQPHADWAPAHDWAADHPAPDGTRVWPIDVNWICQGPFFQCWILFEKFNNSPAGGKVTLLITTPPADGYPLTAQITRPPWPAAVTAYPHGDYADSRTAPNPNPLDPGAQNESFGVWVVGEEDPSSDRTSSIQGTTKGLVPLPWYRWYTPCDPPVTVRPAEWEGGVLNIRRAFQ